MDVKTAGVVLRAVDYKESDRILTVLTAQSGLQTVKARGCRRRNSPLAAGTQLLVYSEMDLFAYRDHLTLREAAVLEQFWGVREDVVKLALASYFAEVAQTVAVEGEANPELMSLLLNSLYALDKLNKPPERIRAAFDLRCMVCAGYAPLLDACAVCGVAEPEGPRLNLQAGVLHCARCRDQVGEGTSLPLTPEVLEAMRYIVYGDPKRLFSFRISREGEGKLAEVASAYLTAQLERGFRTLDFYRTMSVDINQ